MIDKDKYNTLHDKVKPRTVSNQEGEDDEDTTSSDITMTTLCINQPKVHMFYIRFTYYIFRVFLFAEVLAWAKEKRPSVRNTWIIEEVDWDQTKTFSKSTTTSPRHFGVIEDKR